MNALLLAALLAAAGAQAPAPAARPQSREGADPVFHALEAEVARARTLTMPPAPGSKVPPLKPYFVSASVNSDETFAAWASFGALQARSTATAWNLGARMRVGSPAFDNTNFQDYSGFGLFAHGGSRRLTPAEPDEDALRQALWLTLDETYKGALEALAKKKAYLATNEVTDPTPDFAPARVSSVVEPEVQLQVDKDRWTDVVRKVSHVFLANPQLEDGTAWFRAVAAQQTMVTTDPAHHRFGETLVQLQLGTVAQARDGMELRLSRRFTGRTEQDLPPLAELEAAARALSQRTSELAKAPLADEDYAGPVLFVDQAAAMFFLETVGEPLSNPREPLGSRPAGRLLDRLGKRVAARFITARDDPTLTTWGPDKVPLWGHFVVDDDSVKPQPITLIDQGVLRTYYMSRTPTEKVQATNGHCRGEQGAPGTLLIETSQPTPRAKLEKRLVELAADEDYAYGLEVETMTEFVPRTYGNDGQRLSQPVLIWKVFADGRRELVRGLSFKPVPQRLLKEVEALGDDPQVLNLEHRGQRTSVVAPAVLVKLMELSRVKREFEKPPLTPRP